MKSSDTITRRTFLADIAMSVCSFRCLPMLAPVADAFSPESVCAASLSREPHLKEVMFYKKLDDLKIECSICPKKCRIADLERGFCGNKENRGGTYYSLVYASPCSMHVDPIEKKPLFHYLPGSTAYSIATAGCNFECRFCQNWQIAQYRPEQIESTEMPPASIAEHAAVNKAVTIAYTYSEPVVFYEYMYDCAREGRHRGIGSVMISNGFINEEPLGKLCGWLTGVKIDLKAFSEKFYRDYCSGELEPVLHTLKVLRRIGIWFEIVVLIIPTLNDSQDEVRSMCAWISTHLGPDVPVHFTRFHPMYKIINLPPTPIKTLENCHALATATGLRYVYLGNVPGHPGESTYCPKCKKAVIRRMSYSILENNIKQGSCSFCGCPIPGVWKQPPALKL